MGKYPGSWTINEVYHAEARDVYEILEDCSMMDTERWAIINALTEAYYQLHKACASERALERLVTENGLKNKMARYTQLYVEEEAKYPFRPIEEE